MNPLAELNDIVLAEPIGAWPIAWGWWLLVILVVGLILGAIYWRWQYLRNRRVYQAALSELADTQSLTAINSVVKRAALQVWPARDIAALQGADWQQFLIAAMPAAERASFANELQQYNQHIYQPSSAAQQQQYARLMERWLLLGLPKRAVKGNKHV